MGRKNLKRKLFILFVAIGMVPLIAVLVLSGFYRISEMERMAREEMWTKTAAVDSHITDRVNMNFYVMRTAAFMPSIRSYVENTSPDGDVGVLNILNDINEIFRDDNLMALTNAKGVQLVRTDNLPGVNISKREHYQKAINGQDTVSNVITSMASNQKVVVFASPVRNNAGAIVGLVQRNFTIADYQHFIDSVSDANTSIILMDREGEVLAQSNKNLLGDSKERFTIPTQFVSKAMAGVFGVTRIEVNGVDSMVSYRRNHITGWPIVMVKPYSYMVSRVNEEISKLATLGVIFTFLISLTAYRFSGKTVKPIHDFISNARKVASGGADAEDVVISTDDEVGEIAEAFNTMRTSRDAFRKETERDTLTGVYSKDAVEYICKRKIDNFNEPDQNYGSIAFYIVDLDSFKDINKTYGRLFGDRVLLEFAQKLSRLFRPLDCVGRLEGDEFIVVVDQVADIDEIVEKAKHVIRMAAKITIDEQPVNISASVGIAFFPQNGGDYESVFRAARQAISVAKSKGKGSYHSLEV